MKYTCNTQGCAKEHVVYTMLLPEYADGEVPPSEPIFCSYCGEPCVTNLEEVPEPEPEISLVDVGDLGPHIEELQGDSGVQYTVGELYAKINLSAHFHPLQGRIIMRELVHQYLLKRELNG